jgi:hypothetical protein
LEEAWGHGKAAMAGKEEGLPLPKGFYGRAGEFPSARRCPERNGNPFPKKKAALVMEYWNLLFRASQNRGKRGMGVDDGPHIRPGLKDAQVQAPLGRGETPAQNAAGKIHRHDLPFPQPIKWDPRRGEEDDLAHPQRNVSRASGNEAELAEAAVGPGHPSPKGPQGSCAHREAGSPLFP